MGLISIGGHTFARNPGEMTSFDPIKYNASLKTYSSIAYFSWGTDIVGKHIEMKWALMKADEYSDVLSLYVADNTVLLNPNDGLGTTYNVEMVSLNGSLYRGRDNQSTSWRRDIILVLLILSEA